MTIALLTLALAVPALAFAVWPLMRRAAGSPAAPPEDERAGLETEKSIALRALRELELDRLTGHLDDKDYEDLRVRYEGDAIQVLRRLDALSPVTPAAAPLRPAAAVAVPWTRQPAVLGLTGAGLLVFGVILGLLVSRYSIPAPPEPGATSMAPSGPSAMGPGAPPGGGSPRPLSKEMLSGMLQAAHASLDAGRYQEAISAYTAILRRDPQNVEATTHMGVILALAGHLPEAVEAFDRALAIDPSYSHALWDKAGVQETRQDHAGAAATLERFVRVAPPGPDRDRAEARLRDARAKVAAARKAGAPAAQP